MCIIVDANLLESLDECLEWTLERVNRLGIQVDDNFSGVELYDATATCMKMIVCRILNIEGLNQKTTFDDNDDNVINFALGQLTVEIEVNVDGNLADIRDIYLNYLKTKVSEQAAILIWTFIEGYYSF